MNGILQKLEVLHGNSTRRNKKWFKRKPQKQRVTTRWRRRRESQEAEERKRNKRRCCSTQKTELLGTRKAKKELTKRGRGRPFFPRVPLPPPFRLVHIQPIIYPAGFPPTPRPPPGTLAPRLSCRHVRLYRLHAPPARRGGGETGGNGGWGEGRGENLGFYVLRFYPTNNFCPSAIYLVSSYCVFFSRLPPRAFWLGQYLPGDFGFPLHPGNQKNCCQILFYISIFLFKVYLLHLQEY